MWIESALSEHQENLGIPAAASLFEDSNNPITSVETETCVSLNDIPDVIDLSNKVFFVQFTPEDTMRERWYLIQVDIESTLELNPGFSSNNFYWCVFLAIYPDDHKQSDELCRWWPACYRYTT